ncbi:MAG: MFS transporter [Deltaproteobacteria bacterium]|nr:MFS transporter [Deltaproteobacteria bacterium]
MKSTGLWYQIRSMNRVFWVQNWMELLERFAYYGVRTVLPTYMVLSIEKGGPEFNHIQKGNIYLWWAVVQSFLPMFTGGFADRYGYKRTIAVAIALKVIGYGMMAHFMDYGGFFAGCLMLAAGTAIFKPGVQGTLATVLDEKHASVGWGIFYQCVNIGGFVGPILAGHLRLLDWKYVFWVCAGIVSLNYISFLFYKDPKPEVQSTDSPWKVFKDSVLGFFEPRLIAFIVIFSGYWLMFYQLYDILPNFIDDWVNTGVVLRAVEQNASFLVDWGVIAHDAGRVNQESMINLNAFMIIFFMVFVARLTGLVRPLVAIIIGIAISCLGIFLLSVSMSGWFCLLAIAVFTFGEMAASPKKLEYLSSIAQPGKKGLFLGYANAPVGIGWGIGSTLAGHLYEKGGDKVNLARDYLTQSVGLDRFLVDALPKEKIMSEITFAMKETPDAVTQMLWDTRAPYSMWYTFTAIGAASAIGMIVYNYVIRRADAKKAALREEK